MFRRILKRDLKRKKTMNVILLLFIAMAAMFASASANNITAVVGGIDYFCDKAKLTDYAMIVMLPDGENEILDQLRGSENVKELHIEPGITAIGDYVYYGNENMKEFGNYVCITPVGEAQLNYFDSDNRVITEVPEGKAYVSSDVISDTLDVGEGEHFQIKFDETVLDVEYIGRAKDAFLGSEFMGNPRVIINDKDYAKLVANEKVRKNYLGCMVFIDTDNASALEEEFSESENVIFSGDRELIKKSYVLKMMIAGILLVVSVGMLIVSFVVLRFTIGFTISEEFREIGVMKALGLSNTSIRALYLVKYVAIAVIGAVIGFFGGIPFADMLISQAETSMVLNRESLVPVSIICCAAVVLLVLIFCWSCTRRIKKLSPIDAVRSGQTGERFKKRSIMRLGKSHLGSRGFLASNDILSSPKQYGLITVVFTICILIVQILAISVNTLKSEKLIGLFGALPCDAFVTVESRSVEVMNKEFDEQRSVKELEEKLAENGMPAEVHLECVYSFTIKSGDKKRKTQMRRDRETDAADYHYTEGTPPQAADEIAITKQVAEKLDISIGDRVLITIGGEDREFIVTAFYQDMNSLGWSGRFHQDADIADEYIMGALAYQVYFTDSPSQKEISERLEKIKDIDGILEVQTTGEIVYESTGAGDAIKALKNLSLVLSAIIVIMISVLMERSFITKEKTQIALLKATGFTNGDVVFYHTLRFGITVFVSAVTASLICMPVTKLVIDPVFVFMGAIEGVEYELAPVEVCIVYPAVILLSTLTGAFLTALYTKKIKPSDTASID